ncbi:MAG: HAD hydrolase family protein, partial [Atopobiaceae bacterium]|nr:HAD hydrolase family protein [Atopobiaceae bacterium]
MIKLVLADMDGTLVPFTSETASPRTLASIDALRMCGIEFGCATGRTNKDVTAHLSSHPEYTTTGIYASGKQVFVRGEQILSQPIPSDVLAEVARVAAQSDDWLLIPFIDGFDPERPYSTVPVLIGEDVAKVDRILSGKVDPETGFSLWPGRVMVDEVPDVDVFCVGALVEGGQANIGSLY